MRRSGDRRCAESVAVAVRQPGDRSGRRLFEHPQQLSQRLLTLAPNHEVDVTRVRVCLGRQARIVAADDDPHAGPQRTYEARDPNAVAR